MPTTSQQYRQQREMKRWEELGAVDDPFEALSTSDKEAVESVRQRLEGNTDSNDTPSDVPSSESTKAE